MSTTEVPIRHDKPWGSYTFMARNSFTAELLVQIIKERDETRVGAICLSDRA